MKNGNMQKLFSKRRRNFMAKSCMKRVLTCSQLICFHCANNALILLMNIYSLLKTNEGKEFLTGCSQQFLLRLMKLSASKTVGITFSVTTIFIRSTEKLFKRKLFNCLHCTFAILKHMPFPCLFIHFDNYFFFLFCICSVIGLNMCVCVCV